MDLRKKLLWTFALVIILSSVGFPMLKWLLLRMDVVYSEYPEISEYQERGWVPFSPETLKEAKNIRAKTDVSSNDSFIRFDIGMKDLENFILGAKEESKDHQTVQCQDNTPECVLFKNDPDQIIRFDLVRTSHLGEDSFVFLFDPVSGEVVGGGREFPFREYLVFD